MNIIITYSVVCISELLIQLYVYQNYWSGCMYIRITDVCISELLVWLYVYQNYACCWCSFLQEYSLTLNFGRVVAYLPCLFNYLLLMHLLCAHEFPFVLHPYPKRVNVQSTIPGSAESIPLFFSFYLNHKIQLVNRTSSTQVKGGCCTSKPFLNIK